MVSFFQKNKKIVYILLLGVVLRYAVSLIGSNYDLESYQIVGKLIAQGKNVYAETYRYNYGPAWALILGLYTITARTFANVNLVFRLLIITTLILSDIAIFFWLKRTYSLKSALWFFLNPISLYITGCHNQFDALAIALALYSSLFLIHQKEKWKVFGLVLLGISITVKHLFIFYPLWLFFGTQKTKNKFIFFLPFLIFACSFIPFLFTHGAFEGIWTNVITYKKSTSLYPFFPSGIARPLLMAVPMLVGAYLFRKEKPTQQLLLYLLILVAITPISAAQYFAIPLVGFSGLSIVAGTFYTLFATWGLFFNQKAFITVSSISFALCWIPLVMFYFKKTKIYFQKVILGFSLLTLVAIAFQLCSSSVQFFQEQKKEFSILKVLHPAWQIFPSENKNNPQHIVSGTRIEGNFVAVTDNLGFLTIPYILENPGSDFFKKNFTVTVSAIKKDDHSLMYSEKRNIAGGLTQDGLILGMPLIKNVKGKTFTISLTSTIPNGPDYISLDPFAFVQSRYFLTRAEILKPQFILKFIWYKIYYTLSLKSTWLLIYYCYCLIWGIVIITKFVIEEKSIPS